jgi:hypothetical protein
MVESDGDGGWLTYSEAAELLGTTAEAVRRRARRYNWPRMRPNLPGEPARVQVPEMPGPARHRPPSPDGRSMMPDGQLPEVAAGSARAGDDHAQVFETAITALSIPLAAERARVDQLLTDLADARAAERISADAAAALRHELELLRARPWWRRRFK